MKKKLQVATTLEDEVVDQLDKAAESESRSRSGMLRYIITDWLNHYEGDVR